MNKKKTMKKYEQVVRLQYFKNFKIQCGAVQHNLSLKIHYIPFISQ